MREYQRLKSLIASMDSVLIAYSGGVDSTLAAKAATDALGEQALCVFVDSELMARREVDEAAELARELGLQFITISVDPLSVEGVVTNPADRCYHCKKAIFQKLRDTADERGLKWVIDGSNADDERTDRPGLKALVELGVRSPLKELKIGKERVRAISRRLGLPTWNKQARPCLATRVPYGVCLSAATLRRIEAAEKVLHDFGFENCRVRDHGSVARIEVNLSAMKALLVNKVREQILHDLTAIGYAHVAVDLSGYEMGSMDKALSAKASED